MERNLIGQFIDYLDCYCEVFEPMPDDDEIRTSYLSALEKGQREGFFPILITPDETLLECLLMNSVPDNDYREDDSIDQMTIDTYRNKILDFSLPDGRQCVDGMIHERREDAQEDGFDWEEVMGEVAGGQQLNQFLSYWNYETRFTEPVIMAHIPVSKPWQVFAYLPFGGWNECPDTLELMAVSKYWYETYQAVPAALSHDQLEYYVPEAVNGQSVEDLALEQYAFCPDRVDQCGENCTIGELADCLSKSTIWYFWWD